MGEALLYYEKALERYQNTSDPEDIALVLLFIGNVYFTEGKYRKAEEYFLKAQNLTPEDGCTLRCLAEVYEALEHFEEAKAFFDKAIFVDPTNAEIIARVAKFFFELERFTIWWNTKRVRVRR